MASAKQPPVIVLPGIMGTGLEDYYPIAREEVWSAVLAKNYDRISMHPDDPRFEALGPARILPNQPFGLVYGDLVHALRHDLSDSNDAPTPVFQFGYDWRQDCGATARLLDAMVDEALARTRLLPHYRKDPPKQVDLVGHSMGGVIIADYVAQFGGRKKVRRVVTIGAPIEGSVDAVVKLATGLGTLTGDRGRDREREAARTIPAVYQLLPTFDGAFQWTGAANETPDLMRAADWQASVLQTLATYARRVHAERDPEELLASFLDGVAALRRRARGLDPVRVLPEGRDGWLAIVGVNEPTQVEFGFLERPGRRRFEFRPPANEWPAGVRTGDGTVPFLGACPAFLERERLLCVTPQDFGLFELGDKILKDFATFHAALPTVNLVQRLALKFLKPAYRGQVWAHPAPGVAASAVRWPRGIAAR